MVGAPAGRPTKALRRAALMSLSTFVVGVALGPIPSDRTAPSRPSPLEEYR
ncbi:hypothetical protein [Rhodococcus ruber]|uniref:hypothetical protein n=1 Tax=Rhodococcus ruber TaxID=1830 RepID=UPI0003467A1F|nr:hypothetical protein [Rhodococcus ruber]